MFREVQKSFFPRIMINDLIFLTSIKLTLIKSMYMNSGHNVRLPFGHFWASVAKSGLPDHFI